MNDVFEELVRAYCFEDFYLDNICIKRQDGPFKKVKKDFELIIFNSKKIIFIVSLENTASREEIVFALRSSLNCIANKLSLSLNDFVVCGYNASNVFFFNKYNDYLFEIPQNPNAASCLIEHINNDLSISVEKFDYNSIRSLSDALILSSAPNNSSKRFPRIKSSDDGKTYVYKNSMWREASELNIEHVFPLAVFGGPLGLHLFYQKKNSAGIFYILTFGLFGVGWLLDCIQLLLGIYKDKTGKYLVPFENKLAGFLMLVLAIGFYFGIAHLIPGLNNILKILKQ